MLVQEGVIVWVDKQRLTYWNLLIERPEPERVFSALADHLLPPRLIHQLSLGTQDPQKGNTVQCSHPQGSIHVQSILRTSPRSIQLPTGDVVLTPGLSYPFVTAASSTTS